MRIGISALMIQRGKTGIAQHLFALLRAFLARSDRHEFVLFILTEDIPLFSFASGRMKLVPVPERFRSPIKNIVWHQVCLPKLAKEHRLDVLHVPSYRRLVWQHPCALVATIHDLAPFRVSEKYDRARMFYGKVVVKRLAARQHEIIAVSRETAQDIGRYFGIQNVTVIPNGVEHQRFYPHPLTAISGKLEEKYKLQKPFFLYTARLEHPGKNHLRLISAFDHFKTKTGSDWQLVFAGSDWHGADVIHSAIKQSPFSSDIRPLGFVPDSELPDLYRAAGAFIYPSLFEGFGMPVVEAMASGCPVICSSNGALGEVAGTSALTVDPLDVSALQEAMTRMACDAGTRKNMQDLGLARAKLYNWESAAEATIQVYGRAVARYRGHTDCSMAEQGKASLKTA